MDAEKTFWWFIEVCNFHIEQKFEIFLNIDITKKNIFPALKEMIMEEYLSDITNDMIVCLIQAGSVLIRSEIS